MRFKDYSGREMPYIPPGCPTEKEHSNGGDISDMSFDLISTESDSLAPDGYPAVKIEGWFYRERPDDNEEAILAHPVDIPADPERMIDLECGVHSITQADRPEYLDEVSDWFKERIEGCHGITPEGQCWALSSDAWLKLSNASEKIAATATAKHSKNCASPGELYAILKL